jgi:16S rRNA (uracil1498-N3)-methyltransferase
MPRLDFTSPRLFVSAPLAADATVALDRDQSNYLGNVLRREVGDIVLVFNGRDGEWRAALEGTSRRSLGLRVLERTRPQPAPSPLVYAFAPLKHARLDYMVQKAVEMGAGVLQPVITRRTQVARVNGERMASNAVEAAEQCGVLNLPLVREPVALDGWLTAWPDDRLLVFCDEDADVADALAMLAKARSDAANGVALLIGPEGGFDADERRALLDRSRTLRVSLGPRILRADTAAVAALALIQATLGDWR